MKIELIDNLLHASLMITYKGKSKVIDHMVVDTGAAYTLISSDAVDDLGIFVEPGDEIIGMIGIGGEDYSFRKTVESLEFGGFRIDNFDVDFGLLDSELGINGLIGLDILLRGEFLIDLGELLLTNKQN